jgi:hypothetical protein
MIVKFEVYRTQMFTNYTSGNIKAKMVLKLFYFLEAESKIIYKSTTGMYSIQKMKK